LGSGLALTEFNNENAKKHRGGFIRVLRSTDSGLTWSGPFDVGRLGTIEVGDPAAITRAWRVRRTTSPPSSRSRTGAIRRARSSGAQA